MRSERSLMLAVGVPTGILSGLMMLCVGALVANACGWMKKTLLHHHNNTGSVHLDNEKWESGYKR